MMRVHRKVTDTDSKMWCQGGAAELAPGCRPFEGMELGVMPMLQKSWDRRLRGEGERQAWPTMCSDLGLYLSAGTGVSGLTQSWERRVTARPPFRRPVSHSQPSSRVAILWGQRSCKNQIVVTFSFFWLFLRNHTTTNILLLSHI